jgi:hypothetical protein
MEKLINFLRALIFNDKTKIIFIFLCFFAIFYFIQKNLYVLEFIIHKPISLLILFFLFYIVSLILPLDSFWAEMDVFNEGPKNKSKFLVFIRNWSNTLFIIMILTFSLAVTNVNNLLVSYIFVVLYFVSASLYMYQAIVYIKAYILRIISTEKHRSSSRYWK